MKLIQWLSAGNFESTDDEVAARSLFAWNDVPSTDDNTVRRLALGMAERAVGNAAGEARSNESIKRGSSYERRMTMASGVLDNLLDESPRR